MQAIRWSKIGLNTKAISILTTINWAGPVLNKEPSLTCEVVCCPWGDLPTYE